MTKTKNFLIQADIGEEYPLYVFMINAKNESEAQKEAKKLVKDDYTEQWNDKEAKIYIQEVKTLADFKKWLGY